VLRRIPSAAVDQGDFADVQPAQAVYGFSASSKERRRRALYVHLTPLAPSLPEVEKTLHAERTTLVVGTARGHDIVVDDSACSRKHCSLVLKQRGEQYLLTVQDSSTNGTWLGGVRVPKGKFVPISVGQELLLRPKLGEGDGLGWSVDLAATETYF